MQRSKIRLNLLMAEIRVRNIESNHTGLAAVNLWLHNMHVMNKYYWKNRKNIEYPIRWGNRIKQTILAALFGWTPTKLRTEKQWIKAVDNRFKKSA